MTVLAGLALAGGLAAAEAPSTTTHAATAAPATKSAPKTDAGHDMAAMNNGGPGMGMGMMSSGMGGMGMMAGGMMGGMCPMGGADTHVAVKNTDKGVTITFTSTDPAKVARLQKMAEAMRLMHEANTP
jgi:hypothetical protein